MLTKSDLESIMKREAKEGSPVLSLYLNVDRSQANPNHHLTVVIKQMLKSIEQQLDERRRQEFTADADRATRLLSTHKIRAQSLVIFCDDSENYSWMQDLNAPVRNGAWWEKTPYVRPLLEVLDDYERYGVILSDKSRARLFTVFLGEIEEQREAFALADVRHIKTTGKSQLRSQQVNIQRKAEEHARWHLKNVAEMMDRLADMFAFDRLVLAGPVEATSELRGLLPKRLQSRIVSTVNLPIHASEQQVLQETLKIEQEIERQSEIALVEELITAAAKQNRAAQGWDQTLQALHENRIYQLIYAEGCTSRGKECTQCASLFVDAQEACTYCGAALHPVADLIERLAERVVDNGGKVERVRGVAAQRLQKAGGVGALLRF